MYLYTDKSNRGSHRTHYFNGYNKKIKVESVDLDTFLSGVKPDVIKIDIKGGEYHALKGMQKLIKTQDHLIIFVEYNQKCLNENGISPEEFFSMLQCYGFKIFYADEIKREIKNFDEFKNIKINVNLICKK